MRHGVVAGEEKVIEWTRKVLKWLRQVQREIWKRMSEKACESDEKKIKMLWALGRPCTTSLDGLKKCNARLLELRYARVNSIDTGQWVDIWNWMNFGRIE